MLHPIISCWIKRNHDQIRGSYLTKTGKNVDDTRMLTHSLSFSEQTICKNRGLWEFFSNGFIKLVQKTDIAHSKCHLFFFLSLRWTSTRTHTYIRYVLFDERKREKRNYPPKTTAFFFLFCFLLITCSCDCVMKDDERIGEGIIDRRQNPT